MSTTRYAWRCDKCRRTGAVKIGDRVDLWAGVQRLISAHTRTSPKCPGGRDTIRIFSDETLLEVIARGNEATA